MNMAKAKTAKDVTTAIKTGLAYSHNKEIRSNLERLLETHENDLEDVGYEVSTDTESVLADLENAMNEFDEAAAARRAELQEAIAESKEAENEETGEDV